MKLHFAVFSGICAAAASVFGKLCGLPVFQDIILVRLLSFVLMLICNAGVWTLFVKALHQSESSLAPTVISTASNYFVSALCGFFIFNEVTGIFWWCGMGTILLGLLLILHDQKELIADKEE